MLGPYILLRELAEAFVDPLRPGVYVLGDIRLTPRYVGRSDCDLRSRLLQHAGEHTYWYFWYDYALSDWDAYLRESALYNRYRSLLNNVVCPALP